MANLDQDLPSGTLLIYLPCYLDFKLSLNQAKRIRKLFQESKLKSEISIKTLISINGLQLTNEDMEEVTLATDFQVIFPFGISGDINITQGFMHAIRMKAEYLWILSSNDAVSDTFVESFQENLMKHPEVDLLVGSAPSNLGIQRITSVFDPEYRNIPFGLISAVIYRTARTSNNFDTAVQLNWTGWGQLATIEASCMSRNGLIINLIEEQSLYTRSTRGLKDPTKESQRIRNGYAHSFFGMPIVINSLFSGNPTRQKKLLNGWVRSNWHLVNFFLNTEFRLWDAHIASNQSWLRTYANAAIRNASFGYRMLFGVSKIINLSRCQGWLIAKWGRAYLRRKSS